MNALESGEGTNGRAVDAWMREVQLDDLLTGHGTGVADAHGSRNGRASSDLIRSNLCVGVVERRKAQAVAERIQRLLGEVAIGPAVHAIAAERRDRGGRRHTSRLGSARIPRLRAGR